MAHLTSEGKITDIKLVEAVTSQIQQQSGTASFNDVDHSLITYTPSVGSNYVLYEYSTIVGIASTETISYGIFKLVYSDDGGSTWTDLTNGTSRIGSSEDDMRYMGEVNFARMLDNWGDTERSLKLQFKRGGDHSTDCRLHTYIYFRDSGGNDTNTPHYKPFVMCSSITNGA